MELVDRMLAGDQIALARLISRVENRSPEVPRIMAEIHPHTGRAYRIGITGPPGAGKSTMVDKLTGLLRQQGATVGVVAVDPTSPFTGGALLGDRIRMQQHYLDPGVFIRSMGTRGSFGGLARATKDVVKLLDAFGKDYILVETVGVGQTEMDIVSASDTVVVVLVPEGGDSVQAMKAGLMEIADIFVINKADRGGAERMQAEVQAILMMNGHPNPDWPVPVLLAEADHNKGMAELYEAIGQHRHMLETTHRLVARREGHSKLELVEIMEEKLRERLMNEASSDGLFAEYLAKVKAGVLDPYTAANELFKNKQLLEKLLTQ